MSRQTAIWLLTVAVLCWTAHVSAQFDASVENDNPTQDADVTQSASTDEKLFTVPQKAFGM